MKPCYTALPSTFLARCYRAKISVYALIFVLGAPIALATTTPPPIIDMHLHGYTDKTYYVAKAADGTLSPPTYEAHRKAVFSAFEKHNIVHAVVSTSRADNILDANGILIPGLYTEDPPEDVDVFEANVKAGKIKVFGEVGAVYAGKTLSDPEFAPFLDICDAYGIPVAIHTGGGPPGVTGFAPRFRIPAGDPYLLEDVLVKYPNLKIYMMHAGTSYYAHTLELMRTYPSIYVDLGVILWWDTPEQDFAEAFLRKAKRYGYIDRVLYGSDQMVWPHAIEKSINQLRSYDFLSEQDKRDIFYNNAVRFLGLDTN